MIIDCISDLHGHYPTLAGGDLLIVAGDLTARDSYDELVYFEHWIHSQQYKQKVVVAGNHDTSIERNPNWIGCPECTYLCDSGTEFEALKIYGSPWTKTFEGMNPHCMAFTCETEEQLADKFETIPHDVDILITHSPPLGILDKTIDGKHVGARILRGQLIYCYRPKLWVCGHIHESYGQNVYKDMTIIVNASHVNEQYEPVNKPIRVIL